VRQLIIPVLIVPCGMGVFLAVIFTLPPLVVTAKEVPDSAKRVELQNSDSSTTSWAAKTRTSWPSLEPGR
jgi:hypothetical protein